MNSQAPPVPNTPWSRQSERSALWVLRLMRWIALRAGRRVARLVLHPIALYFLLTGATPRRESRRFLTRALRRPARWADVYRHIHHFACTVLDRVYLLQGRHELFDVALSGGNAVDVALARGGGALLVGAHMGSFEALRAVGDSRGLRVAMLMYEDNARLINATLAVIAPNSPNSPNSHLHTISLGRVDAMLELKRWLDSGGVAGMLADRSLPGSPGAARRSRTHRLPFLGQAAPFSDGPFRLAALLRRPIVFMAGLYLGHNRYRIRFIDLADFSQAAPAGVSSDERVAAALQAYVATLEALCFEAPYNWFNFFDFWADATRID